MIRVYNMLRGDPTHFREPFRKILNIELNPLLSQAIKDIAAYKPAEPYVEKIPTIDIIFKRYQQLDPGFYENELKQFEDCQGKPIADAVRDFRDKDMFDYLDKMVKLTDEQLLLNKSGFIITLNSFCMGWYLDIKDIVYQAGGEHYNTTNYYEKYMKYKIKYLNMKKHMKHY